MFRSRDEFFFADVNLFLWAVGDPNCTAYRWFNICVLFLCMYINKNIYTYFFFLFFVKHFFSIVGV